MKRKPVLKSAEWTIQTLLVCRMNIKVFSQSYCLEHLLSFFFNIDRDEQTLT